MLTIEKFEDAYNVVSKVVANTNLIYSDFFSKGCGNKVYLKPENMQKTGAYKIRGAYYKISTLSDEDREKGLITASAGNHAQGVAYAAQAYGVKATIVMPTSTPLIKVNRTKAYGAEVVLHGDVYDDACQYALKLAEEKGYTFIHPFDDLDVATGQSTVAMEILKELPFVDIILGTFNSYDLKDAIVNRINKNKKVVSVIRDDGIAHEGITPLRSSFPNAWVNISYGCNNFCTYCIVPYVRGRERSRDFNLIVEEVKKLVEDGYKEITLLGQNVDSYGNDLTNGENFLSLLKEIDKIDGNFRIRFMSNHPKDITKDLVTYISTSKKICNYIHLPVQSGSTEILKKMNRKYSREKYLELVEMIRSIIPDCAISTDIMVGFPGETDLDYEDSLSLMSYVKFDGAFTFVYSIRPGTVAATMDNQISEDVKKARIMKMVELQNSINAEKSLTYIDKKVTILCEDYDVKKEMYMGRDEYNRMIYFPSNKNLIGEFVDVTVVKTGGISLYGEVK